MDKELSDYIMQHCRNIMTSEERAALRRLTVKLDSGFQAVFDPDRERLFQFNNENVNSLVSLGMWKVQEKIANRIYKEHKEVINLCPKCNKLARTPNAKQCRYCFYDWH